MDQMDEKKIAIYGGVGLIIVLFVLILIPKSGNDKLGVLGADFFNAKTVSPAPQVIELKSEDLVIGSGVDIVSSGDTVTINYIASFLDGKQFENSYERKQPFVFEVGKGVVMPGIDKGILGMKAAGKRKLTIPSSLAYGEKGQGPVGPNTPVVFEIEVMIIKKAAAFSPVPTSIVSKVPSPTQSQSNSTHNDSPQSSPTPTIQPDSPTPTQALDSPTPTPE